MIVKNKKIQDFIMKLGPLLALIILCIILTFATKFKFVQVDNIMNILRQASVNSMIAAGMLIVLITAGIDLSVGANCALATCVMGVLMKSGVQNSFLLILSCLLTGVIIGYVNGFLLTELDLPHPFVSTMGMKSIVRGLALLVTLSIPIGNFPVPVQFLGASNIFLGKTRFPVSFVLVIIVFSIFHVFLTRTELGRQIYCVGGNPEAARLSGVNSKRVLKFVYTLSGFMAALGGLLLVGRVNSAIPLAGETFDSDAIASCIIGGASFMGGKGTIWGTLIGSLLITVIRNGLNLIGASADLQQIVIGAVIILAVFIDVLRVKLEDKARRLAAV